jgi:opacity protein-like surface antigen
VTSRRDGAGPLPVGESTLDSAEFSRGEEQTVKMLRVAALALLAVAALSAPAAAQVVSEPGRDDLLGPDIFGFFEVSLGAGYVPAFNLETKPSSDGFSYRARNPEFALPAFVGHLRLTPAFGDNGIAGEFGWELVGYRWRQETSSGRGDSSGETTLALNQMSGSVNYVRYFLPGADRLYLTAGGGFLLITGRAVAKNDDDELTTEDRFTNWRVNAGFGYLHQFGNGALGVELRGDVPLLPTELSLKDPQGDFDVTLSQSVIVKLCATFSLGRLKNR